ncbi:oxygen-independent coproporphyrinogen-3 oxidase [Jejuia pallidilutea]|uniref:Heme chaperone HemW n=1 Tax=Jejuia pallidilutea TaxID=504487 RepID=A0A362X524_9FLAO|nr:radical SAM family heme chaperone HemW [Jejuia pallidilutea]PQV51549.1 oxygen-independent coproporphyrinogen-3 oxidase [Jejuia pallidilutea]
MSVGKSCSSSGRLADSSGIYIHIPFCKQACYYCDFHFSTSLKKRETLIQCLVKELELRKSELQNKTIATIYFGGGTPSLLSVGELHMLIDAVYKNFKVVEDPEITLEANPDDLTSATIKALSNSKVNRLSIGVQSFFERDLKLMNRAHNATEAKNCLLEATQYFKNISVDLIYGIPGLSNKQWEENINIALSYNIPHLSCYALTVEPKTALESFIKKGIIENVDDDAAQAQFQILVEILENKGFVNYELSNFGKPNFFSANNSAYWQGKPYLGIGPSAHSFTGDQRSWNVSNNTKYIKSIQQNVLPLETETLTKTDKFNEYVMTGLRTIWGVSLDKVETDFGLNYKKYLLEQAEIFINQHLLYIDGNTLLITKKGKFLSDGIASSLFKINLS